MVIRLLGMLLAVCLASVSVRAQEDASPIAAIERHPSVRVVSAWLSNGIRVHTRSMPEADTAAISITLAGGVTAEGADARGVAALLAGAALGRGVHTGITPEQADAEYAERGVRVTAVAMPHDIRLDLVGPASSLPWMLERAAAILRTPRIDAEAARAWRQAVADSGATDTDTPEALARAQLMRAMFGNDVTFAQTITDGELDRLTPEFAEPWAETLITRAPTEVAIVGPAGWIEAMRAAETSLSALPHRSRIAPRGSPRAAPRGPYAPTPVLRTNAADRAFVAVGLPAPGSDRLRDLRAMILAREVLGARLEPPASVSIVPGEPFARRGLLSISSTGSPDASDRLALQLTAELLDLAAGGPNADELEAAHALIDARLQRDLASPAGWARRLCTTTQRGLRVQDLAGLRERYASITADDIRAVMREALDEVGGAGGLLVIQAVGAEAP